VDVGALGYVEAALMRRQKTPVALDVFVHDNCIIQQNDCTVQIFLAE
jgi:hypothetical protein